MAVLQSNNTAEVLSIQSTRTSHLAFLDPNPEPAFLLQEANPLIALNRISRADITAMVEGSARSLRDFGRSDVRDYPANRERRAALILVLPNRIHVGFAMEPPVSLLARRRAGFHLRFALCAIAVIALVAILVGR
jgi:hypothetical protein